MPSEDPRLGALLLSTEDVHDTERDPRAYRLDIRRSPPSSKPARSINRRQRLLLQAHRRGSQLFILQRALSGVELVKEITVMARLSPKLEESARPKPANSKR